MSAYIVIAIWLLSNFVSYYLIKKRNVDPDVTQRVVGVLLGPLALLFVFFLKPKSKS